jgi:hypothetical protein
MADDTTNNSPLIRRDIFRNAFCHYYGLPTVAERQVEYDYEFYMFTGHLPFYVKRYLAMEGSDDVRET